VVASKLLAGEKDLSLLTADENVRLGARLHACHSLKGLIMEMETCINNTPVENFVSYRVQAVVEQRHVQERKRKTAAPSRQIRVLAGVVRP
jgi:hypothetical protein